MATYYFRSVGGNWGSASNWSLSSGGPADGAVPTNTDIAIFDSNSAGAVLAAAAVCNQLITSGFVGAITMSSNNLTVGVGTNGGNITLSPTTNINATTGILASRILNSATASLISNGATVSAPFSLSGNASTNTSTFTLQDDWKITGQFNPIVGNTNTVINGGNLYLGNGLNANYLTLQGTSKLIFNGSGTWINNGTVKNNIDINMPSNLTLTFDGQNATGMIYGGGTLRYISGGITFSRYSGNGVMNIQQFPTTLDTGSMSWDHIILILSTAGTVSLTSNLNVNGTLTTAMGGTNYLGGAGNIFCGNWTESGSGTHTLTISNLTCNDLTTFFPGNGGFNGGTLTTKSINVAGSNNMTGTANIVINGIGGTYTAGAGTVNNNLTFNSTSTTISGTLIYATGTLTYTTGVITSTGATLQLNGACTLQTNGMTWNSITVPTTGVITLNNLLQANTITLSVNDTFGGNYGYSVANLTCTTAGTTHTLAMGVTYTVTGALTLTGTNVSHIIMKSSTTGTTQSIFTVTGTTDVGFGNAININSNNGNTVWSYLGTFSNTLNWQGLHAFPVTTSSIIII